MKTLEDSSYALNSEFQSARCLTVASDEWSHLSTSRRFQIFLGGALNTFEGDMEVSPCAAVSCIGALGVGKGP